jgi:hypothetical protein
LQLNSRRCHLSLLPAWVLQWVLPWKHMEMLSIAETC